MVEFLWIIYVFPCLKYAFNKKTFRTKLIIPLNVYNMSILSNKFQKFGTKGFITRTLTITIQIY